MAKGEQLHPNNSGSLTESWTKGLGSQGVKVRGWNGHPVKTLYPDWVDVELLYDCECQVNLLKNTSVSDTCSYASIWLW